MGSFDSVVSVRSTFALLTDKHYLGPTKTAKFAWRDYYGVMVFGSPRGRNVPPGWLELLRWCLVAGPNSGSQQWRDFSRAALDITEATTIVSYSDPSVGHTGALYRACNWLWAPTWHRLRPPPSGNGRWTDDKQQAPKDRWIFPLRLDEKREATLSVKDAALVKKMPWAQYREPKWKKGRPMLQTGGGDYRRFSEERANDET